MCSRMFTGGAHFAKPRLRPSMGDCVVVVSTQMQQSFAGPGRIPGQAFGAIPLHCVALCVVAWGFFLGRHTTQSAVLAVCGKAQVGKSVAAGPGMCIATHLC